MITILAEKPSVAREIARIVGAMKREEGYFTGNGYHVTWALGHLVQLALPDGYGIKGFRRDSLPVIPKNFELIPRQVKTDKGYKADAAAVKQIKVITKLWNESDGIIVATDCAREGELIFRYLYSYIAAPAVPKAVDKLADRCRHPQGIKETEGRPRIRQPLSSRQSPQRSRLAGRHQRHTGVVGGRRARHVFRGTGADTHADDGLPTFLGEQAFPARTGIPAPFHHAVGERG